MPKPRRNRARERRIEKEIVVDACSAEERALGRYYYLEQKLALPFRARCTALRAASPLRKGEIVEVLATAKEDDCMHEPFVLIRFGARGLGVPLAQLAAAGGSSDTRRALEDWRYWTAMGYWF